MISNIHMSPVTFTNTVLKAWILDKFSWSVWNIAQSTWKSWQGNSCEEFFSVVILELEQELHVNHVTESYLLYRKI